MSEFNGQDLFGSDPHWFIHRALGSVLIESLATGVEDSALVNLGPRTRVIAVRGRLTGADWAALGAKLDAIRALTVHPPQVGTLIDGNGESHPDMSFVSFVTGERVEYGASASVTFEAVFAAME